MKLIVDNLAIEYIDKGEGPVLLCLHGWGDNLHTFDEIINRLYDSYRIITLDLPGFGESEVPKETWDISRYIQFVEDFCAKLQVKPVYLLGHSFGGRIAIKGIGTGKLRVKKLVLIGSAGITKTRTIKNLIINAISKTFGLITYIPPLLFFREKIKARFYLFIGSDYYDAGPLKSTYLETIHEDLQNYATELRLPTLLIWGEVDRATPLADAQKLHHLIKGSQLEIIPGSSHFVHWEHPEKVAGLIKGFLK